MKIGFYTFGDQKIGMGHLYRTERFFNFLKAQLVDSEFYFFIDESPEARNFENKFKLPNCHFLKAKELPNMQFTVLFVDRLMVDTEVIKTLKKNSQLLVSFDDAGPGHYQADIAVNALYPCTAIQPTSSKTKSLTGFKYLPLDPNFTRLNYKIRDQVKKVLVCQGGTDTYNKLPELLRDLANLIPSLELHALVGPERSKDPHYLSEISKWIPNQQIHSNVVQMTDFLLEFDIVVSAVGMTAFEVCALGIPLVAISDEPKEEISGKMLREQGLYYSGKVDKNGLEALRSHLSELVGNLDLRKDLSQRQKLIFDGQGFDRILQSISQEIK